MIFVECKPDEVLIRRLTGLPRRQIVHELKGKFEICKRLAEQTGHVGVIDDDPGKFVPQYLQRIQLSQYLEQHGLKQYEDNARSNRVIAIYPELESWIIRAASESRLELATYDLPNAAKSLHSVINVDLRKFDSLLDDLLTANSPRIKLLSELLSGV